MSQEAASTEHQALVSALQGWHRAKDQATRYNRNLLQYAAAIAAVLGIGAGGGGIIAVAGALSQIDEGSQSVADWAKWILVVVAIVVSTASVILVSLLVRAFRLRRAAEYLADEHLAKLIDLQPDHFFPEAE